MKNIHIIPTDKASRIHLDKRSKELLVYENYNKEDRYTSTHNIYIINNEEIKEGDWCFDGENPYKWTKDDVEDCLYNPGAKNYKGCKKIILTTDQDLIADGIEQISEDTLLKIVEHINSGKNIESFDEL